MNLRSTLYLILSLITYSLSGQINQRDHYLYLIHDSVNDQYGYVNYKRDTIINYGKYSICYTDTFKTTAIVLLPKHGFVAIDQNEKILYNIFPYDNGPDYISDRTYRIIKQGKIGYANQDGKIIIQPQFDCAYPFEKGRAKVSINCKTLKVGEHSQWTSDDWYYIDKNGTQIISK